MSFMAKLPLTPDELLTTTRSVRKRLDLTRPVPLELIRECLEVAMQAPSASNRQAWQWMVITEESIRRVIGDYYRRAVASYLKSPRSAAALFADDPERNAVQQRVGESAPPQRLVTTPTCQNRSVSSAVGEVAGPRRVTVKAATTLARRTAASTSRPAANPAMKAPRWASPAPVVSTMVTGTPGT